MKIIGLRDFRELRQSNAFRVMLVVVTAVTIAASVGISIALGRLAWLGEETARPLLVLIISLVAYFLPFLIIMAFTWGFASLPVIKEKINGNIECLLATPISPGAIWMGKCLAIFLPGFAIAVISTLIVLLVINLTAIVPAAGVFVLPPAVMITGLVANPLLVFGLLSFILLFSLANNPDIAIAPSFILGFGLMMGLPIGIATGAINLASWSFALAYLGGTAVIWAGVLYLTRLLTRQNIVMSSKGS